MARNKSFSGNVENLVAKYNSIRADWDFKVNKREAVGYLANEFGTSQKEVYRILSGEKERGELYVYSRNIDKETAEGIRSMRNRFVYGDGSFIRGSGTAIADEFGISKSSV